MVCQKCKCTADVMETYKKVKEDKEFLVQVFQCRNKQCSNYGKEVATREILIEGETNG